MVQARSAHEPAGDAVDSTHTSADVDMFEDFRARLLPQLARWGAGDEAEDLAHEALIVLLQRLRDESLIEPERAYGYLVGTAKRLVIAAQRKKQRRKTDVDSTLVERATMRTTLPEQQIAMQELAERTHGLVDQLKQHRDRLLVQKHYLCDQDHIAIENDMELSASQIYRLLYRCRQRLRVIAEPQASDLHVLLS